MGSTFPLSCCSSAPSSSRRNGFLTPSCGPSLSAPSSTSTCVRLYHQLARLECTTTVAYKESAEPKKVLKPDVFQDFVLKEKTVISHNVAMYVTVCDTPRRTTFAHSISATNTRSKTTATASTSPRRTPSSASPSASTSRSARPCPSPTEPPRRSSARTPRSAATTSPATLTS